MSSQSHQCNKKSIISAALAAATCAVASSALALPVTVTVENLSAPNGLFLTPVWVGFHNGSFDLYDRDVAVGAGGLPPGLEALVEDGNTVPISDDFAASAAAMAGGVDSTIDDPSGVAGPIDPGHSVSADFDIDPAAQGFFSYALMVVPSSDAFIANGNPLAFPLFDAMGNFTAVEFFVLGADVLDAGTEVNTEIPADTAFLGQTVPNTGPDENGVVTSHPGFNGSQGNPGGMPVNILGGTNAAGGFIDPVAADFTQPDYQLARITVTAVTASIPVPPALALLGLGLAGFALRRRR